MFGFPKKSCTNCLHYSAAKSKDVLNPDKSITKGKIEYEFCSKGQFYLTDHNPCELHKEICEGDKRSFTMRPSTKSVMSEMALKIITNNKR